MVDRKSRTELASALRQLFNFRMTTAEFRERAGKEWFASADEAVRVISFFGSSALTGDMVFPSWLEHGRLDSIPAYRKAARCIWFLQTDLSYQWPRHPEHNPLARLARWGVVVAAAMTISLALFTLLEAFTSSSLSGGWAVWLTLTMAAITILGWLLLRFWFHTSQRRFESAGDYNVWPFHNRVDYRRARQARATLRSVSDDIE
ncbi:MAG: hypothetical protein JXM70_17200 [Pirellulales bacterium]|nr:hypothetical protein [Pirellulales bacterium]